VLGIELRFFPSAKALLYFEGVAVDRVYPGDALNSAMIVIDVLARGELSNRCEFPLRRRAPFTIAEILSLMVISEHKTSDFRVIGSIPICVQRTVRGLFARQTVSIRASFWPKSVFVRIFAR
jgi:hypothetical protein